MASERESIESIVHNREREREKNAHGSHEFRLVYTRKRLACKSKENNQLKINKIKLYNEFQSNNNWGKEG